MKTEHAPLPPHFVRQLCKGVKIQPEGIFWKAFDALKKCNEAKAHQLFEAEYILLPDKEEESQRAAMIFALASDIPPYTKDLGWIEILAAAGLTDALGEIIDAERASPIHALHAEIELGPRFFPNPTLSITEREATCLLSLYEIEAEVLMDSPTSSYHIEKWLNKRNQRAVQYISMLQSTDISQHSNHMLATAF